MSRSYKKTPVYTDGTRKSTKRTKRIANQIVRQRNKAIVRGYLIDERTIDDQLTLDGQSYKKYFCSWNIHDYTSYWTKKDAIEGYECSEWWAKKYKSLDDYLNSHWKKFFYRK
jgi:hypothetical protein